MSAQEALLQHCRDWLKTGASLNDDDVLVEDDTGPVDPPYLTVKLTTVDQRIGHDEEHRGEDGTDATVQFKGHRQAVCRVRGFGDIAGDWIEEAAISLREPSLRGQLRQAGIRIDPRGPLQDTSQLLDTDIEPRFERDFTVYYAIKGEEVTVGAADDLDLSGSFDQSPEQSDSDDLDYSF